MCPKCRHRSRVLKTFEKIHSVIRYRKCDNKRCNFKFKTTEMVTQGWDYRTIIKKIKEVVEDVDV